MCDLCRGLDELVLQKKKLQVHQKSVPIYGVPAFFPPLLLLLLFAALLLFLHHLMPVLSQDKFFLFLL
jgi:hypothetical protein